MSEVLIIGILCVVFFGPAYVFYILIKTHRKWYPKRKHFTWQVTDMMLKEKLRILEKQSVEEQVKYLEQTQASRKDEIDNKVRIVKQNGKVSRFDMMEI